MTFKMFQDRALALWSGEEPLPVLFWVYNVAAVFFLNALGMLFPFVGGLMAVLAFLWAAALVKPVFSSADRFGGDKNLAVAARVGAVLIAALMFLGVLF